MLRKLERVDAPELMDSENVAPEMMHGALDFLSFVNRCFGGTSLVLKRLSRWAEGWNNERPIRILDVGTGGAEIPIAIAAWARRKKIPVHITAIDLVPDIVAIASKHAAPWPEIDVRLDDFFELDRRGEKFDYSIATLFLHHVRPLHSIEALRAFDRVSERGVIISDLLRTPLSLAAVSAASFAFGNEIVRHDGPLSVRRAFLPPELDQLAAESGLSYLKAAREPWFRVSLSGEKFHVA